MDPIKYIPLGREGWYLSLGGDFRPMYEFYRNYNWGVGLQDEDGYYLNRLIAHSDFHFGERVRVFFETKSGVELGRNGGPRPVQDQDKLDISQLFLQLQTSSGGKDAALFSIKVGRQELQYGEGNLLDVRDLNVRRAFDGVKFTLRPADWRIDLFAMKPVQSKPGFFDDFPDSSQTFWGVYAITSKHLPNFVRQLDVYYLGLDRKKAQFDQGIARDQRHTIGILVHGQRKDFSYFVEGDLQFGKFGNGQLLAWKYAQSLSYAFSKARFHPTVSLLGAISSGDKNLADPDLQTYYPLFPKGLYYGYIDDSGSLNAIVVHPKLSLQLSKTLSLSPDTYFFWRQRTADGLYSQPGILLRTGRGTQAQYVGALQDLALTWAVDRHTTVQFLGAYYEVGPYLRETSPAGKNTTYFSAKMNYRF